MSTSPMTRLAARPVWLRLLLLLMLVAVARLAWDLLSHWTALAAGDQLRFWLLLSLRCVALAAGIGVVAAAAIREPSTSLERSGEHELLVALRAVAYVMLAAIAIASLTQLVAGLGEDRFAVRSAYRSGLLLATSVWVALSALAIRRPVAPRGQARWIGVVLVNLFLALLAMEAVALVFARLHPTRLLWNEGSAQAAVEANRLVPGTKYLGFSANSGGYYDDEFERGGPEDLAIAVVTDSFGVGIVPHKHNFTTVLERRLAARAPVTGRVVVNNFGVASIGLPEYAWLLENEVPATSPTKVVVGLFIGNDISALAARPKRGYYSLQQLQLFELARRLAALGRAGRLTPRAAAPKARGRRGPALDPRRATFDEERFLAIERSSMEMCNTESVTVDRLYALASEWLARLRQQSGDDLLVVLMPDEYQVNDELWDALLRRVAEPATYDREFPQKRLAASCRDLGIEVLDLLEPLRRASVDRPVYGLRDTHWNVRGNRVAGEAIAEAVLAGLGRIQAAEDRG